jgi:hypothetical protein
MKKYASLLDALRASHLELFMKPSKWLTEINGN